LPRPGFQKKARLGQSRRRPEEALMGVVDSDHLPCFSLTRDPDFQAHCKQLRQPCRLRRNIR